MTAKEVELVLVNYFDPRRNLIVPNVWWGFGLNHECDLIIMTNSGWAYEIEIKVSRADLKADLKKRWGHHSNKIRKLYFAVPEKLEEAARELVPVHAGILTIGYGGNYVHKIREAKINQFARPLTEEEGLKLAKLGCMRIWPLKRSIRDLCKEHWEAEEASWRLEYLG